MLKLVFFLSLVASLFAQDANQAVAPQSEQELLINADLPEKIYKNQIFLYKIKVLNPSNNVVYSLSSQKNITILNQDAKFTPDANQTNVLSLYIKANANQIVLPKLTITSNNQTTEIASETLNIDNAPSSPFGCNVLAKKLTINSARIDTYDSATNIVLLDIVADFGNLTDFHFPSSAQQGVTQLKNKYPDSQLFYFVTIPNTQNVLEFQYFNTTKNQLETVSVPLDLQKVKDLVSTQGDLQPKAKDKAIYIFIVVSLLSIVLYAIYYFKRDKIFLILIGVSLLIGGAILFWPSKTGVIKKDCVAYLLPTENSTPFYKTSAEIEVEVLKKTDGFTKIKLENSRIGWVKDECIGEKVK